MTAQRNTSCQRTASIPRTTWPCIPTKMQAGATRATFGAESGLSEAVASWPLSRLLEVWNSFAGVPPPFALRPPETVEQPCVCLSRGSVNLLLGRVHW